MEHCQSGLKKVVQAVQHLILCCSKLILELILSKENNWTDLLTTMKLNAHAGAADVRMTCIFCTPNRVHSHSPDLPLITHLSHRSYYVPVS
jgi:hypothetical protein